VEYEFAELDELSLAYVTSIHKSQESEYPAVVIPLAMQHYSLLERNLIYTAVTLGKNGGHHRSAQGPGDGGKKPQCHQKGNQPGGTHLSGPTVKWQVYITLCSDNSFYTGITTNFERRFRQHALGRGTKYFRRRQPLRIVYREVGHDRSSATKREAKIKAMNRADKELLVSQQQRTCLDFYPETGSPVGL
jgi:putative endonuclease